MKEIRLEGIIYKINIVNQLTMIFHNPFWFKEYASWLEYSITKDAAYCLYCYLFRPDTSDQGGGDSFVIEGFRNWKKKREKL